MRKALLAVVLGLVQAPLSFGAGGKPLLLQRPAAGRDRIAFVYAGDLWTVGRDGGEAKRLTSGVGLETDPVFSPDGSRIAFSGQYEGNLDVYVVPADGGVPKRLTYHPGIDMAVGWTPDGKKVLFRSDRASYSRFNRLFTVSAEGGFPEELPLPMGEEGAFSPDGARLAYVPFWNRRSAPGAYISWKHYRGGKASPIWIANLADSHVEKVPRKDSNDFNPMWVGKRVYFLSDRNGPTTLFSYEPGAQEVTPVLDPNGADVLSASAGPDFIAYETLGALHTYDLKSGKARPLEVRVTADLPGTRRRYEKVGKSVRTARLSPTGVRVVVEARGEILTLPREKGQPRNLTDSPGVADRDPAWSPNGKWVAYFSDASGEYELHLRDQRGQGAVKKIKLGDAPSFYYHPVWSPDSKRIAYTDKRLQLWVLDLAGEKSRKVDRDTYDSPIRALDPVWSPDGLWLAYTKQLKNHMRAVFLYDVSQGKPHQLTDGLSDARFAAFDKGGKYLYFTASTDVGPTNGWLDMSSMNRPVTRSAYVVVLSKDQPSPLAPESDEEKGPDADAPGIAAQAGAPAKAGPADKPTAGKEAKKKEPAKARIDLENIDQRILALPLPARNYTALRTGKAGVVFLLETEGVGGRRMGPPASTLHKFDLAKRKSEKFLDGVAGFDLSHDGEKLLYRQGDRWLVAGTAAPPKPGEGALKMDELEVRLDPPAEWKQMYREVWRLQRDYLYDPGHHGYDLKAAERKYRPYLEGVASRSDLNYLFNEMLGELTIGHLYVAGGDTPEVKPVQVGLLGADYRIDGNRYRFARVYHGENWTPGMRAPLTQPGVNVKVGEYLLAVNGHDLTAAEEVYKPFEATAGKSVRLKVGPKPDGTGAREVTVVPIPSEQALRNRAWIEDNRRKVDRLSGGRLAYVYLPDTSVGGYTNFNRYFFAQVGKEGAVIDERFNGGGSAADYIIDNLSRPLMNYWTTREGEDFTTPLGSIFGPKAMIINEFAGSGGDAMPWYFRKAKVGPLVGKRTWGGLIGIYDYPQLIDGGMVTAPRLAFWNPDGKWEVENYGVAPDLEVEHDPQAVRAGRDPQLERAVAVVLEKLKKHPLPKHRKPPYPNYHPKDQRTTGAGAAGRTTPP